jgi:hypothetical protein
MRRKKERHNLCTHLSCHSSAYLDRHILVLARAAHKRVAQLPQPISLLQPQQKRAVRAGPRTLGRTATVEVHLVE